MPRDFDTIYNDAELSSEDDNDDEEDLVTLTTNPSEITYPSPRPILVGYAFGPKKMSTMGIIMAEASQLMNSAVLEDEEVSEMMDDGEMPALELTNNNINSSSNNNSNSHNHHHHHHYYHHHPLSTLTVRNKRMDESLDGDEPSLPSLVTCSTQTCSSTSHASSSIMITNNNDKQKRPKLTIDALEEKMRTGMMESASSSSSSYNHNIYPFRRNNNTNQHQASSLSSNASQSSSIISGLAPSYIAYKDVGGSASHRLQLQPVRVSFVPLDLDSPLEEQHGGRFDVILHKMTEDILCISTSSPSPRDESSPSSKTKDLNNKLYTGAMSRIQRLNRYKLNHPSCCLVDHPDNIKALMSRSDIARILSTSLIDVTTTSGIPVRTPRFFVCPASSTPSTMRRKMNGGGGDPGKSFTYPIIAKPLTAAGTVKSHRMVVVLGRKGLSRVPTPCLVQEYANHDGVLYKVYVLGDTVWVFSRSSLPNLPMGDANDDDDVDVNVNVDEQQQKQKQCCSRRKEMTTPTRCFVEFDSQRPYPKLSDFGVRMSPPTTAATVAESVARGSLSSTTVPRHDKVAEADEDDESSSHSGKRTREGVTSSRMTTITTPTTTTAAATPATPSSSSPPSSTVVTADEIRPVVSILSKAFGLELFGFDILVTNARHGQNGQKEMLVVDVNYFPSYKEVMNFPSLLAQYLTKRAVNGMRQTGEEGDEER